MEAGDEATAGRTREGPVLRQAVLEDRRRDQEPLAAEARLPTRLIARLAIISKDTAITTAVSQAVPGASHRIGKANVPRAGVGALLSKTSA